MATLADVPSGRPLEEMPAKRYCVQNQLANVDLLHEQLKNQFAEQLEL